MDRSSPTDGSSGRTLDRSSDCSWDRPSARSIRNRAIGTLVRPSAANDSTDSTRIVARSRSSGPSNSIPKPESNGSIDRGNAGASQTLSPLGHAAPGLAVPVLVSSVLTWSFIRFLAKPARILNNKLCKADTKPAKEQKLIQAEQKSPLLSDDEKLATKIPHLFNRWPCKQW
jgi:hypothetical protein